MYSFLNDYSEGAYPAILQALIDTNLEQHTGYGADEFSQQVQALLQQKTQNPASQTFLVTGGTQANLLCLGALLRPVEAVICADSGHIFVNEAGAIEATGHKVIAIPSKNGKVAVDTLSQTFAKYQFQPHVVRIKAVYITHATEVGTLYSLAELAAISEFCRQNKLYLMMDGARLGTALASDSNDIGFSDLGQLVDIFWLGGTKMGALLGEAIVINQPTLAQDFAVYMKQHGALLAKGRVLGLQFLTLLKNDTFLEGCAHANNMAKKLGIGLQQAGFELAYPLQSNQVFAIISQNRVDKLHQDFAFYEWQKLEADKVIIRLVTSWATDERQVEKFLERLND